MIIYLGIIFVILLLTRALAYWGVFVLKNADIPLIPDVLYLSYVENRGAAFGIFQDSKLFLILVAVILFLIITYYVAYHRKQMEKKLLLPLSMIAGGGIANVADRLQFGFVVDYIDFRMIHYPVFNLADICVVVGVSMLALAILFTKDTKDTKTAIKEN